MRVQEPGLRVGDAAERGQVTILAVAVVVLVTLLAVGLGRYGEAVIHRIGARTAADSIALATASDPQAGAELAAWYETQQFVVEQHDGQRTLVRSGPSMAAAWASTEPSGLASAPALRAIVARAEQLRGQQITSPRWGEVWIEVRGTDAQVLVPVAAELGLCEVPALAQQSTWSRLELC